MPNSNFVATITAKGKVYSNWESMMVRRDFGNGVSFFQFSAAEDRKGTGGNLNLLLQPGDAVQVRLGGHLVISGNVTTRSVAYDARSHSVVIAGKSSTMDLIDSSVIIKPGNYDNSTFEQAARGVMAPHPVKLIMQNPPAIASKPFQYLSVQYGETVGEFISRIAMMRGLILTDDENGNLVAGQGNPNAAPVAELYEGKNILRAVGKLDDQTAWSKYQMVSQSPGADTSLPPRWYSASGANPNARPNRFKLGIAEHPLKPDELQQRVNYEVVRSMWPSVECSITVVGWFRDNGELWKPTENVSIYSPMIFPTQSGMVPLGIQACTYAQDSENGTTTSLELVLPWLLSTNPDPGVPDIGGAAPVGESGGTLANPNPTSARPDAPDYGVNT